MSRRIPHCAHWGAFTAVVEDDRIVGIEPFEHDPAPSPILQAVRDWLDPVRRIDRPSASRVDVLERIAAELVELERDRLALLVRRDELVDELRAGGVSWGRLARLAGTSRQALM